MGEARQTILVKSLQMQKMNSQFHSHHVLDTVNILHFSDSLVYDYFRLVRK